MQPRPNPSLHSSPHAERDFRAALPSSALRGKDWGWGLLIFIAVVIAIVSVSGTPAQAQDTTRDQQWREDLAFLATELPSRHIEPFHTVSQADWENAVAELDAAIPTLNDEQIRVRLMQLVALIGDGHTGIAPSSLPRTHAIPLLFHPFSDGLVLMNAPADYQAALGMKLAAVGGVEIETVIERLGTIIPHENDGWLRVQAAGFLAYPELLYGLDLTPTLDSADFTFAADDGSTVTLTAAAVPLDQVRGLVWVSVPMSQMPAAAFQRHNPPNYWYEYLPDSETLFIAYTICADTPDWPFADFLAEVIAALDAQPMTRVVVDLRSNTGGDSSILEPLIDALAVREERLYVLIGPRTYSSAILNAIQFQQRTSAVLAGEPTGGKPNHYGEFQVLELPNSHLQAIYATEYFRYTEDDDAPALLPDMVIPITLADFLAGRDPVLEAVIAAQ